MEFFLDVAGSTQHRHMHHAVFTFIDANHHTEDWTYMMPGDKPLHAHLDLQREKGRNRLSLPECPTRATRLSERVIVGQPPARKLVFLGKPS